MHSTAVARTACAALLAALLAGCSTQAEIAAPPRIARVAQVEANSVQGVEVYPGDVHARHESGLGFRVSGKINARKVDVGAHVRNGQVLATIDPRDLELAQASAQATLASAEAAYQLARSEHDRYKTLSDKRFVSQFDLEAKTNALAAAKAHVTEARAALDTARNQANYAELRADADGVITAVSAEAGQVVGAGQVVMTLAHDGPKEVEISVPEQAIAQLEVGAEAAVELWTESGTLQQARVREIAPDADSTTRTYRVRVAFAEDASGARLGQTARVYFTSAGNEHQVRVPLSALYEKDGEPAIWLVDPNTSKVHLTAVELQNYGESGALINNGLESESWIVTAGVHRLREGEVINPIDDLNRRVTF
ncbi:efflux RND transporter periplasmic adaptor subunit [Dokdonella sp.]|uniref:efflux RND transporter periplasmic adaptor subunit n=1 Tax=Dokdonella sp. TaxID=2291710 RepID=UPI003527119A